MNIKSFFIEVLGCPMRAIEAQRLNNYFIANSLKLSNREEADLVVVFTCSVVDDTENKTISYVDSLKISNKRMLLLGCSPGMSPKKLTNRYNIDMIATKDLETDIDKLFPDFNIKFEEIDLPTEFKKEYKYGEYYINQFASYQKQKLFGKRSKSPTLLITSKGCNNNCSYCTMKRALGPVKSYSLETLTDNYRKLRGSGNLVFVFNADDTGAFGIDIGFTFAELLDEFHKIDLEFKSGKPVWIIDNLHPMWAIRYQETINYYVKTKKIVEMIIPLQSASDRILKLMKRKHNFEDINTCIKKFKLSNDALKLKTHFIIGFPTENQEEIKEVKNVIEEGMFEHVILLRYYEAEDSNSSQLQPKIPEETVSKRVKFLENILIENKIEYMIDGIIL